jgi:hypothetical protein
MELWKRLFGKDGPRSMASEPRHQATVPKPTPVAPPANLGADDSPALSPAFNSLLDAIRQSQQTARPAGTELRNTMISAQLIVNGGRIGRGSDTRADVAALNSALKNWHRQTQSAGWRINVPDKPKIVSVR